jgi:hypothetical protein
LARKDTTGGARCRTVGYMEIDKYLSKLLDSIEDIKIQYWVFLVTHQINLPCM